MHFLITGLLSLFAIVGLLAIVSPSRFRTLSNHSNHWVDSEKTLSVFDKKIDIDHLVMPHIRILGIMVLAAVTVLAYVFYHEFL